MNVRDRFGQNTLKTLESTMCIQCLQYHIFSAMIQVVRVAFSIFVLKQVAHRKKFDSAGSLFDVHLQATVKKIVEHFG